jgi:uncharacterized protein YqgC (DUF456 family)
MVLKGLFLIVITLLCALIVIVAIFWAVAKWGDKKNRSIGCLMAILFLVLTILLCGYFINTINKELIRRNSFEEINEDMDTTTMSPEGISSMSFIYPQKQTA